MSTSVCVPKVTATPKSIVLSQPALGSMLGVLNNAAGRILPSAVTAATSANLPAASVLLPATMSTSAVQNGAAKPKRVQICDLKPVDRKPYDGKDMLKDSLEQSDPKLYDLMVKEKDRQRDGLELIASENFMSRGVREALASCLLNKYSEGYPGNRYYGGNEFIDQVENLCKERALDVYGLDPENWGVNVQPYSGSPANFAVYAAIAGPHGRIMGLDLPDGGHLTHGLATFLLSIPQVEMYMVRLKSPRAVLAIRARGISCYSRHLDYARFRQICSENNAYLMADMAHISGLVAAGVVPSPFEYADIVTTTTHKSLRGARGAMIFYRKGVRNVTAKGDKVMYDLGDKIDFAVFPGLQGGPHNHTIAGIAAALGQAKTTEFVAYQEQVIKNAQAMAKRLVQHGYKLATGGTENHLCLVDLRPLGLDGARAETVLDCIHVTCNKNTCPGDKSALKPGGVRLGTPALSSRGMLEKDFESVADFIHAGIQLALKHMKNPEAGRLIREFKEYTEKNEAFRQEAKEIGDKVKTFSQAFPMPGFDNY